MVTLLSRRNPPSAGWVAIDEFENLLHRLGGGNILCTEHRPILGWPFGKVQSYALGPFQRLVNNDATAELLLVVARAPSDLRMLYSLTGAKKRFRKIAGYVIDSYFIEGFESSVREYDHIFSTTEEGAEVVRSKFGVSSSVLRQGFDCLNWASADAARSIELIGFGRQPPSYHAEFQRSFHTSNSGILYLHSPIGANAGIAVWEERPMMLKLLQRAKMSLAFNLMVEPTDFRPRSASFVTTRWLESLAAGCVVIGKRPVGQMAAEMFSWPNALIELPDIPAEATALIKTLALKTEFLHETRKRNVVEMCRRHDWRYRILDILQHFDLPLPELLMSELSSVDALVNRLG